MRFLSRSWLGLSIVVLAVSAAESLELPQSQAEPRIRVVCGPGRAVILKQVTPTYPAEARAKGIQGKVRIKVLVDKNGAPEGLRVASGPRELVKASVDAVRQWKYKPYMLNGKAVPVETTVDIFYVIPPKQSPSRSSKH